MPSLIRQASTRISVDHLVQKGKRFIHVLSKEKIQELIDRSVQTIVEKHLSRYAAVSDETATEIAKESQAEFQELLQQYKEMSRAKSDVERSRKILDEELEKLRKELEDERNSAGQHILQVAPGPVGEVVPELNAQIDRLFEARKKLKQAKSPEAAEDLRQVEAVVRQLIARLVAEREQPEPPAGSLQRENSILQRRLDKLGEYVASLESALKTLSSSKTQSNQQIQNVLRQLGLANEDKHLEKKKEALKVVLDVNRFIRKEAKHLEAKGVTLATPGGSYVEPSFDARSLEPTAREQSLEASTSKVSDQLPVESEPREPAPKKKSAATPAVEEARQTTTIAAATMEWSLDRSSA
ncbi:MAG TPA: hypothetical protein VKU80_03885, partial [Planctomycetota bacterium]|nr:hypothetical protein [Planctomycetota bacterium]